MSAVKFELEAQVRDDLGKSASRRLRRKEKVLGVVYGGDELATPIVLEQRAIVKALEDESFFSKLLSLKVGNDKEQKVILRDIQRHPYKQIVLHMDFLRVKATDKITMTIPLRFIGAEECPGVAEGGIVNHLISEVEVKCQAGNIPEFIEVNIANLAMDDSILLSELPVPAGSEFILLSHEHDPSVVSVHMPRVNITEEEEDAAAAAEASAEDAEGEDKASEEKSENKDKK